MKKIYLLIIAILFVKSALAQWYWQNPYPTGNHLKSIMFPSSNTGYAVGNGTIIKTTDGGNSWKSIPYGTPYSLSSVYFTDDNTGYAAGYPGIILKTTEGEEHGLLFPPTQHIGYILSFLSMQIQDMQLENTDMKPVTQAS
jgi:hypothetical protein